MALHVGSPPTLNLHHPGQMGCGRMRLLSSHVGDVAHVGCSVCLVYSWHRRLAWIDCVQPLRSYSALNLFDADEARLCIQGDCLLVSISPATALASDSSVTLNLQDTGCVYDDCKDLRSRCSTDFAADVLQKATDDFCRRPSLKLFQVGADFQRLEESRKA